MYIVMGYMRAKLPVSPYYYNLSGHVGVTSTVIAECPCCMKDNRIRVPRAESARTGESTVITGHSLQDRCFIQPDNLCSFRDGYSGGKSKRSIAFGANAYLLKRWCCSG